MQHLIKYYKQIYEECMLPNSKVTWVTHSEETQSNKDINIGIQISAQVLSQHPTIEQLRKLKKIYLNEIEAI